MTAHAWLHALDYIGRVITIGPHALRDDVAWEPGMQALVLSIEEYDPEVWIVSLDFRAFMETNTPLMATDYYDPNGIPRLTAIEARQWRGVDSWYLPTPGTDWFSRLHKGPRYLPIPQKLRHTPLGRRTASVFADEDSRALWERTNPHTLHHLHPYTLPTTAITLP